MSGRKRKQKRRHAACVLALALMLGLVVSGCGRYAETDHEGRKAEEAGEDAVRIGISFDSFVIERWLRDRDVFVSTAQSLGAEVNVQNANGEVSEQIAQIRYLISKKMNVIVIIAIDASKLSEVIGEAKDAAKDAGIHVVCYDRLILNAGTDLYVSFDNEKVGTLMGQALKDALPEGGNVFEILGSASDNNTTQVRYGFEKELKGSNLNIVYSTYCDNWLAELWRGRRSRRSQSISSRELSRLSGRTPICQAVSGSLREPRR